MKSYIFVYSFSGPFVPLWFNCDAVNSTVTLARCDVDVDKDNEFDVFISYSQSQKEIVCQIADRLKTEGFKIWIDIEQMCTYQSLITNDQCMALDSRHSRYLETTCHNHFVTTSVKHATIIFQKWTPYFRILGVINFWYTNTTSRYTSDQDVTPVTTCYTSDNWHKINRTCTHNISIITVNANRWLTTQWLSTWFYVSTNQHSIGYTGDYTRDGFTGRKTQPTLSKYWRNT